MSLLLVVVPVLLSGQTPRQAPQTLDQLSERASSGLWDAFSARVTVHRELLNADGARATTASDESFLWERTNSAGGWKTTMTALSRTRPTVQSRAGAVMLPETESIARLEEDGTRPRFFNRAGVEIVLPSDIVRHRVQRADLPGIDPALVDGATSGTAFVRHGQGREWIRSLIMSASDRANRLKTFERAFGKSRGTVRGLGRYLRDDRDGQTEVLVDEQNGVPVEMNRVQDGTLRSQTQFAYERTVSGTMLRRGVRVERAMSGQRLVSEVRYSDIRLEQKGGR